LKTDVAMLDEHLKSADFFDVSEHPTSTFELTELTKDTAGGATHMITGNLKLRGVEKSVSFPANVTLGKDEVKTVAEFTRQAQRPHPGHRADPPRRDRQVRGVSGVSSERAAARASDIQAPDGLSPGPMSHGRAQARSGPAQLGPRTSRARAKPLETPHEAPQRSRRLQREVPERAAPLPAGATFGRPISYRGAQCHWPYVRPECG
jgi:hypothetical protein